MRDFTIAIAIVLAVVLALYLWITAATPKTAPSGLPPGNPAPQIAAQGWINGAAPGPDDLRGQVIVVDAWATWCGPCREAAPDLVDLHAKYKDRGVVFIGLTDEGPESLTAIRGFLNDTGITWLNGYGAGETLLALEAYAIPNTWVIGRDGKIVWSGHPLDRRPLEEAIEKALADIGESHANRASSLQPKVAPARES